MIRSSERAELVEVFSLPDNEAISWLKENSYSEKPSWLDDDRDKRDIVSFVYGRRKSDRLRLAVARYGSHARTLSRVYREGSRIEKLAALSNASVGPRSPNALFSERTFLTYGEAEALFDDEAVSGQRAIDTLLHNPCLSREWVADFIRGWDKSDGLTPLRYPRFVANLADNPIVGSVRDDTYMDGFAEYDYQRLNLELLDLLQTAEVNVEWAAALGELLPKVYVPFTPDYDVDLLERWQAPEGSNEHQQRYFDFLREKITEYLLLRDHREGAKEKLTIEHRDAAVRKAIYQSARPTSLFGYGVSEPDFFYPYFKSVQESSLSDVQRKVVEVCRECFELDGNEFVESLIWNREFWRNDKERSFLRDISWNLAEDPNSYMDVPNLYNGQEARWMKQCPEFFEDDEFTEIPFEDSTDGKIAKLQSTVDRLDSRLNTLLSADDDDSENEFSSIRQNQIDSHQLLTAGIGGLRILLWIAIGLIGLVVFTLW